MFPIISARVNLLQAKRREMRAKIHRTLIVALIAPLFVTISAPPSLGLPNTPSSTPTSPSPSSSPSQEVASPFSSSASLKSSAPITQGANLNSSGLLVRFDAKTAASYSGSGTTWNDISGNGRAATFTGKTSPLTTDYTDSGFTIKGIGFNGTSQFATINSNFSGTYSGLSISFYANLGNATNYERIIDIGDGSGNKNIVIARIGTTRDLALGIYNGVTSAGLCQANSGIDNNTWAHWTFIVDGTNCQIYKNGTAFNSITNTNTNVTSTSGSVAYTGLPENTTRANAYIGKSNWAGDALFEGQIADLAILNRALTSTDVVEWRNDQISNVNAGSGICANRVSNPAAVTVTSIGGDCILKFTALSNVTTANSWVVPAAINRAKVLTVAGGGGGGAWVGGGGGAGGLIEGFTSVSAATAISVSVGKGGTGSSKVGAGGTVAALSGDNSTFGSSFTSLGGGRGASWDVLVAAGGSGGGGSSEGSNNHAGAAATRPEQGFAGGSKNASATWNYGYPTGGGGGAGGLGGNATLVVNSTGTSGAGGNGRASEITGTATLYAGGGGGGIHGNGAFQGIAGAGGSGGGGAGAAWNNGIAGTCSAGSPANVRGGDGAAGLGGGGGGSGAPSITGCNSTGGTGGSGVVIVRYGTTIQVPVKFANTFAEIEPTTLSPYMRFKAGDYDATNKIWYDSSGNGRNTSSIRGTPQVVTTTIGNGSTKTFTTVQGGTTAGVQFKNKTMSTNGWTMFSVARYNGTQSGYSRLFDGETDNFIFGFYWGRSGVAHYNDGGWLPTNGVVTPDSYGQNWVVSSGFTDTYRGNGYAGTATNPSVRISRNVGDAFPAMTINAGQQVGSEQSTWQVAETIIFDRKLDVSEIEKIEDYLARTYGIQNYVSQSTIADTVTVNASSGSVTLSSVYTAKFGYQNTFSVSPSIPGITLESPATNQARLRIASTVAPGTYWETITATDIMGNTAILPVRIEVVPALQWAVSNATTFTTTFGKNSRLKLDLSGGFGTRVAAVAHVSSPAPRGVTIDSTSIANGSVFLVVDTGTAIGTYTESITVTDGSGLIRATILTLTINSPPDITFSAQTDSAFPYVTQNLLLNLDVANPNSYSGSGTTWTDTAGGRSFTLVGSPTYSQANGGTLAFATGKEATSNTNWTNLETFTVETWFKLNSLSANIPCFVTSTYSSTHINFAICQWGSGTLVGGYHVGGVGWQGYVSVANVLTANTWNHAVYSVSKSGSTYTATLYLNGVAIGSATSSYAPQTQTGPLRIGKRWDVAEHIDGAIPVVRIYNASLTAQQIRQNYQNSKVRFVSATSVSPTNSGITSLTATAGTARDFQLFTATDGVGNKTLTLSGVNSGFRIDTSTANTAIFKVLSSATSTNASSPRTYSETLTAVDTNGIATAYYLSVTVSPAILITSTSDTITTTFGRTGSTTLNVAVNTGTGSSTFSRVSSSGSSAITSTFTTGQAVLNVAGTLPVGTYYETLTATDSLGATAFKVITIVVNAALAIVPATGSTSFETTFTRATTSRLNITGGTGNRTYAITYPSSASRWRITLDTSTAASNFVTVRVDSFTATGTHAITVTVTDSLSATASTTLTLNVNEFPILNNVRNENTYIKPGLVLNLDAANPLSSTGAGNWKDLSGAGSSAIFTSAPSYSTANGGIFTFNGSANYLTLPSITTASSPGVTSGAFPEYTAETWVRFSYPSFASFSGTACLICEAYVGTSGSMNLALSIRNNGQIHSGYLPTTAINWVETVTAVGTVTTGIWYHIAATVVKSGINYINTIYLNGVAITSSSSTHAPATSSRDYYIGRRWDSASQLLNGSVGVVRVYNRGLTQSEIQDNYNALVPRYINTSARSSTFTTTQGASASSTSIPATLGTGNKTLALTPVIAGITADTSTANAIRVNSASTLAATDTQTARTYVETITATDTAGAAVTHLVNVTVNPPIILSANSTSIATTSGIETSTVITASRGSSTVTFTRTGTSTSGITLTAVGNQATLRVLSTINPGTYFETVTATDTASATTSMMFTIVVAPPPSITGSAALISTAGYSFTSPSYSTSGGSGVITYLLVSPPTGVSLSASIGSPSIRVASSGISVGTYNLTLRATDAVSATTTFAVTLTVNGPVGLSGSPTITKNYGISGTYIFETLEGTSPFTFSTTNICSTEVSTSGGITTEKIMGAGSCDWQVPAGVTTLTGVLAVGGGGGGGWGGRGGGGGAGEVESSTAAIVVSPGNKIAVTVGAGGEDGYSDTGTANWRCGFSGGNTLFGSVTALGGGGGAGSVQHSCSAAGITGGSGGGGNVDGNGGASTKPTQAGWLSYGNNGAGITGGGGGAGAAGNPWSAADGTKGKGGAGITLMGMTFAGGGGAWDGGWTASGNGFGGSGGGGRARGAQEPNNVFPCISCDATSATGSGGGAGGRGGSGFIAIQYPTPTAETSTTAFTFQTISKGTTGRLRLTIPAGVPSDTYTATIRVFQDTVSDNQIVSYPYSVVIRVNKGNPTLALSIPGGGSSATYGSPVTISGSANTAGNFNFRKGGTTITGCGAKSTSSGVSTCTWTPTDTSTAVISAVFSPTDNSNWNTLTSSNLTLTVAQADTLTVTAGNITTTYSEDGSGNPNTTVASPTFTLSGLASIDSITAMTYAYTGTQNNASNYASNPIAPKVAGTYSITPSTPVFTSPGTVNNYRNVTFAPGTLTINRKGRGSWTLTYGAGTNTITYGASKQETPTVTYPGDGTRSFTTTSNVCSINASTGVITTLGVGSCAVTAVLSQTANWLSDTLTATVTINRGPRVATVTPASSTIRYGETATVTSTVTQALDSATVTFSAGSFLGCAVDNVTGEVTGIRAGASCAVSVTYGQTDLYESATASSAMTINKALAPVVTTETITAVSYTGNTALVTPTYRVTGILARDILQVVPVADVSNISLIDPATYSTVASYKYFATNPSSYDSTTAPSQGGTYAVTAQALTLLSGVDISNYETPTYVSSNLVINPIIQAALRILLSAQESITVPYDITFAGGSSTGLITAAVISGGSATGCSVSGLRLSTSTAGTCILQATKAADRNYLQVISETATVTILNFISYIDLNAVFDSGSGITITSQVPITLGAHTCSADCVPEITDIQDIGGNSTTTLTVLAPLRLIGVDLHTTDRVLFTARINGVRLSNVSAGSFQIDSPTQITVMPPANFVPNTGENSSSISVRIIVYSSGGSISTEKIVIISL